jgi:hypothetical protein
VGDLWGCAGGVACVHVHVGCTVCCACVCWYELLLMPVTCYIWVVAQGRAASSCGWAVVGPCDQFTPIQCCQALKGHLFQGAGVPESPLCRDHSMLHDRSVHAERAVSVIGSAPAVSLSWLPAGLQALG